MLGLITFLGIAALGLLSLAEGSAGEIQFDPSSRSWTVLGVGKTGEGAYTETGTYTGDGPHQLLLGDLGMGWDADTGGFLGEQIRVGFKEGTFDRYQPDTFQWKVNGLRWGSGDSALFGSGASVRAGGFGVLDGGSPGTRPQLERPIRQGTILNGKLSWQSLTGTAGTGTLVYEPEATDGFGNSLRVYRLAMAATAEFTAYHGGMDGALEAIKRITEEANVIFRRDLSIHLELISDEDLRKIIYTAPATDPYTPEDLPAQLAANQATLDALILSENYDVGHVLGRLETNGNGRSTFGSVGQEGFKARGVTEAFEPTIYSSSFIGLLVHELGHQFGASHTFNSEGTTFCEDERNAVSAVEPGSGTTLMGFAGVCGDGDLQEERDHYFHAKSIEQIQAYINDTPEAAPYDDRFTGNRIPVLAVGEGHTIPARTPFMMTAMASDPDRDALLYTWEQMDVGEAKDLPASNSDGPLFRSRPPSESATRTFPHLPDLLQGTTDPAEVLPTTARTLSFRATVRDQNRDSGGVNWGDVSLSVVDTGSAFAVTSPNSGETVEAWSFHTVTWNVAGTNGSGIDTSQVHVYLSTDSGRTFPILLATVPNTGIASIRFPSFVTSSARLMIQGAGNVFFDVSDQDFSITRPPNAPHVFAPYKIRELYGETSLQSIRLNTAPGGEVALRVAASDGVELSLDGVDYSSTVNLHINNSNYNSGVALHVRAYLDADFSKIGSITYDVVDSTSAVYTDDFYIRTTQVCLQLPAQATATGMLFDVNAIDPTTTRWNQQKTFGFFSGNTTLSDLKWEDGALPDQVGATPQEVDLFIDRHGVGTWQQAPVIPLPRTIPSDMPEPEKMDHVFVHNSITEPISFTWKDLKANKGYEIYVCAAQNFGLVIDQTVTVTGAGLDDPEPFVQKAPGNSNRRLIINGEFGFERRTLRSFGVPVTASASGEINVSVLANAGAVGVFVNAVRIQEQLPESPQVEIVLEETVLAPDDSVDFGTGSATRLGREGINKVFTVRNVDIGLLISGLTPKVSGLHSDDFQVDWEGMKRTLSDGESTTFKVQFYPNGAGERSASLNLYGRFGSRGLLMRTFHLDLQGEGTESLLPDTDEFGGAGDHFGSAVAVHGNLAVVGTPFDDTAAGVHVGTAVVFLKDQTGNWKRLLKLEPSDASADLNFGKAVGVAPGVVAVGANDAVYIFKEQEEVWTESAKIQASDLEVGDGFGHAVALSASGNSLLVGSPTEDHGGSANVGSAYVFTREAEAWIEQKLTASAPLASDRMGTAVAIDGDTLAVGAPFADGSAGIDSGRVLLYQKGVSNWELALSIENSLDSGAAGEAFGSALALSGGRLLVGLVDRAQLFASADDGSWSEEASLADSAGIPGTGFGNSVALGDGLLVIGAKNADTAEGEDAGSAFVFVKSGEQWRQREVLMAEDAAAGDQFGHAVALSGLSAMVGAPDHDGPEELGIPLDDQGSVYAFPLTAPAAQMDLNRLNGLVLRGGSIVEFGEVATGATGEATIRIANSGDILLTGVAVVLEGADADNYSVSYAGPVTIEPGAIHEMLVEFIPTTAGTRCANLRVLSSDASASPLELILKGTAAPAAEVFGSAILAAGLSGVQILPLSQPFGDDVPNLLKYAFNMELGGPDSGTLDLGGDSGLPAYELNTGNEGEIIFVIEFIRRKGSGLVYTPKRADTPEDDQFVPMTGLITIIPIDDQWERVRVEERCPAGTPRCFSHVEVSLPE